MKMITQLSFDSFEEKDEQYFFHYSIDDDQKHITLSHNIVSSLPTDQKRTVLFQIGMCYLLDLAELTIPRKVKINFGLSELQLAFWKSTFQEMAKEKMYVEQLDLLLLENEWSSTSNVQEFLPFSLPENRKTTALCLTGGKESLALLKTMRHKNELLLFFLNPESNVHRQKVFNRVKDEYKTVRTISNRPQLFAAIKKELHTDLNSGVDMAHLVFNTLLFGDSCREVLIGNEYSSNFPNTVYQGYVINHQYVKTLYFAQKVNAYLHKFVTPDFNYFSPFFGYYEYLIAQYLFANDEYLEVWTSCNQTTAEVNFCSRCAKCAFTYLMSLMYTTQEFLRGYFSGDMLDDVEMFAPLMSFTAEKPLDCVGDKKEVWVALFKLMNKPEFAHKAVLEYFRTQIYPFIESELASFEKEITTIQKVPQVLPEYLRIDS